MRRVSVVVLSLALATMLHIDWHLARPAHHRLSLEWPLHWVVTALIFAAAGWWIGRQQMPARWRFASLVFVAAVVLAQGVEPVLEVLLYQGRIGYPDDPGRWAAVGRAIAAATPAYFTCVWLCGRVRRIEGGLTRLASLVLALVTVLGASNLAAQSIKVTLLGTGGPVPSLERFGPSTLIEAGGQTFLIDAGRGALQRLAQIGVFWREVDGVLLTHLHSDHVVGLPDLWLTGWLVRPGRVQPLTVWGPRGTGSMLTHLREAFAFDIRLRQSDDGAAPAGAQVSAVEVSDGVVYDSGGVRITAFSVDHAPVEPAFGYRLDYAGRSVVVSGDTRLSENLIRHATGVDLLIHEIASRESFVRAGVSEERARSVVSRHVSPEQAGRVFARTRPRLAVYSHVIHAIATEGDLVPRTRREYSGRLEVGVDLMVITIGESIDVRRPTSRRAE